MCITCVFIAFGGVSEKFQCNLASLHFSLQGEEYREAKTHCNVFTDKKLFFAKVVFPSKVQEVYFSSIYSKIPTVAS